MRHCLLAAARAHLGDQFLLNCIVERSQFTADSVLAAAPCFSARISATRRTFPMRLAKGNAMTWQGGFQSEV
jgi:hypothetical protein